METAVALLVFNRPNFTARVFDAVARARPRTLFVAADGPREGHSDDERLVLQTRAVLERVDWPCEVLTDYADHNLGCGRRIASGLDWVFDSVPEAIILEDDCLPHPSFFPYCEELLEHYRDNDRVHMVGGTNVLGWGGPYSYHFSRCYHIWGWATWRRAWQHYDYEMRDWLRLRPTSWLDTHLGNRRAAEICSFLFEETYQGRINQWDFQWVFSGWLRDALAILPTVNLVTNIGFGESATHDNDPDHPFADRPAQEMIFPLRHPPEIAVLEEADRAIWDSVAERYPRFRRGLFDRARGYISRRRPVARALAGGRHEHPE